MESNQFDSPESLTGQDKDTIINANFDLEKFKVGIEKAIVKNVFPVQVFPEAIQEIIKATNENLNFPVDFIGASILYAASVAIGNTYKVQIKTGFQEGVVLYVAIVARPGTNKTHPLSFAIQPIIEKDAATYKEYETAKLAYEQALTLSKTDREAQNIELVKAVWKKFLLSDYTPEALAEVHKFNKRGIGVYCDELAGWFKNFNRYNKGSEMEFWISNFNSKPVNIDRKSNEPIFIPRPFISVCGTIQTGILKELAAESRSKNGFIDRILFVIPDIEKEYWNDKEIDSIIIQNWKTIINQLLNLPVLWDDTLNPVPEVLQFSPEAKKLLFRWQRENTDKCNDAETETLSGIYSKFDMYVCRLALILQMLRWACNEGNKEAISIEAVEGAIKLIEYFRISAEQVHNILTSNPLDRLPVDKLSLYNALPKAFTTGSAQKIAIDFQMEERKVRRFLNEPEYFLKIKHGYYEKLF